MMNLRRSRKAKVAASEFVRKVITGQTSGAGPTRSTGKQKQSPKAKKKRSTSRSPSCAGGSTPTQSRSSTPSRSPARSRETKSKSPSRGLDASRAKSPSRGAREGTPSRGRESSSKSDASGGQEMKKGKSTGALSRNKVATTKLSGRDASHAKSVITSKKSKKKASLQLTESGTVASKKGKVIAKKTEKKDHIKSSAKHAKETKGTRPDFTKLKTKSCKKETKSSITDASPTSKKIDLKTKDDSDFRCLNNPAQLIGHPGVWPISSSVEPGQGSGDEPSGSCTEAVHAMSSDLDSREAVAGPSNIFRGELSESGLANDILPKSVIEGVLRHPAEHLTAEQFFPLVGLVKKSDLPQVDPSRSKLHREAGGKLRRVIKPKIVPEMIYRQFTVSRSCVISDMWSDSDSDECSGRESPRISAPGHILQSEQSKKKNLSPKMHDRYRQVCTKIPLIKIEKVEGEGSPTNSTRSKDICLDPSTDDPSENILGSLSKSHSFKENDVPFGIPFYEKKSSKKKEWLKPTKRRRLLPESPKPSKCKTESSTPSKSKTGNKKNDLKQQDNKKESTPTKQAKKEARLPQPRLYPPPKPCEPDVNQPVPSRRSSRAGVANRKQWWHLLRAAPDEYIKDPKWEEELKKAKLRRDARMEKVETREQEGQEDTEGELGSEEPAEESSSDPIPTPKKKLQIKSPGEAKAKKGKKKNSDPDMAMPDPTDSLSYADMYDTLDPSDRGCKTKKKDWALAKRVLEQAKAMKEAKDVVPDPEEGTDKCPSPSKCIKRSSDVDTDGVFKKPRVDFTDSGSVVKKKRQKKRSTEVEKSEAALMVIGPQGRPLMLERKQIVHGKTKEALDHLADAKRKREGYMEFSLTGSHVYKVKSEAEGNGVGVSLNYYQGHECDVPHMCSVCWINDHMYCRNMRRIARDLPPSGGCIHYIPCEHFRNRKDYRHTKVSPGNLERKATYRIHEVRTDTGSSIVGANKPASTLTSPTDITEKQDMSDKKLPACEADLICEEILQESDSEPSSPERPAGTEMLQVHLRVRAAQIEQSLGPQGITQPKQSPNISEESAKPDEFSNVSVILDDQEEGETEVLVCEYACEITVGESDEELDDEVLHVPVPDPSSKNSTFWEEWNKTCDNINGLQIKLEPKTEEEIKELQSKKFKSLFKDSFISSDSDSDCQEEGGKKESEIKSNIFAKDTFKVGSVKNACLKAKQNKPSSSVQNKKCDSSYKVTYSYTDSRLRKSNVVQARTVVPPVGVPENVSATKTGTDMDVVCSKLRAKLKSHKKNTKSEPGCDDFASSHENSNDSQFIVEGYSDSESVSENDSTMTSPRSTPIPMPTIPTMVSSSPVFISSFGTTNLHSMVENVGDTDDLVSSLGPETNVLSGDGGDLPQSGSVVEPEADSLNNSVPVSIPPNVPILYTSSVPVIDPPSTTNTTLSTDGCVNIPLLPTISLSPEKNLLNLLDSQSATSACVAPTAQEHVEGTLSCESTSPMQVIESTPVPVVGSSEIPFLSSYAVAAVSNQFSCPTVSNLSPPSGAYTSHPCVPSSRTMAVPQVIYNTVTSDSSSTGAVSSDTAIATDMQPTIPLMCQTTGSFAACVSQTSVVTPHGSNIPMLNFDTSTVTPSTSGVVNPVPTPAHLQVAEYSETDQPLDNVAEYSETDQLLDNVDLSSSLPESTAVAFPPFQNLHIIPKTRTVPIHPDPQPSAVIPHPLLGLPTTSSGPDDQQRRSPALSLVPIKIQSTQAELPTALQQQSTPSRDGSQVLTFTTKEIRERRPELLSYIQKAGLAKVIADKLQMEKQSIDLMLANTLQHAEKLKQAITEKQSAVGPLQSKIDAIKYQLEQFIEPLQENQLLISRFHVQRIGQENKLQLATERLQILNTSVAVLEEHEAQEVMQSPFDLAEIELPLDAS